MAKKAQNKTLVVVVDDAGPDGEGWQGSRFRISIVAPGGSMTFYRNTVPDTRKVVRQQVTKAFRKPRKEFKRDDED